MGLLPLEFSDCLIDSPNFRENLHSHEKELKQTSHDIKNLVKQIKELLGAAKALSRAQRNLASSLIDFKLECIGSTQTEDEIVIAGSLKEFGNLLMQIEEERDRMLDRSQVAFVEPLERFRKEEVGVAMEAKKKFEKETAKFCQTQERHLNLSTKKNEAILQEADASLEMEEKHFYQTALEYVHLLQGVQEKKKFEFVETVLAFMYGWLTFYHEGHEVAKDFKPMMTDLQYRLQRTRVNFFTTHDEAEQLKKKMLEKCHDPGSLNKCYTRQGYLFLHEKKPLVHSWSRQFCQYEKEKRRFSMVPYTQTNGKLSTHENFMLKDCIRRMTDSIDKRFCFDIISIEGSVFTFQALSIEDRRAWLDAMDGKEPTYCQPGKLIPRDIYQLDEAGFQFIRTCARVIEEKAIMEQGLYRLPGVSSKVKQLIQITLNSRGTVNLSTLYDEQEYDSRTLTSALKHYLRFLKEPLMTFKLHGQLIAAAKLESKEDRVKEISYLLQQLPTLNLAMLKLLVQHLNKVVDNSHHNLMSIPNLAVCLGPSLLRPEEESMAAIMDIKFGNLVIEILLENSIEIFSMSQTNSKPVQHCSTEELSNAVRNQVQNLTLNGKSSSKDDNIPKKQSANEVVSGKSKSQTKRNSIIETEPVSAGYVRNMVQSVYGSISKDNIQPKPLPRSRIKSRIADSGPPSSEDSSTLS